MITKYEDIWNNWDSEIVIVPVNTTLNTHKELIMGRGIANQAKDKALGVELRAGWNIRQLKETGIQFLLEDNILLFVVKDNWKDKASIDKIANNLLRLKVFANTLPMEAFRLPLIGAGFGAIPADTIRTLIEVTELPLNVTLYEKDDSVKLAYPDSFKPGAQRDET